MPLGAMTDPNMMGNRIGALMGATPFGRSNIGDLQVPMMGAAPMQQPQPQPQPQPQIPPQQAAPQPMAGAPDFSKMNADQAYDWLISASGGDEGEVFRLGNKYGLFNKDGTGLGPFKGKTYKSPEMVALLSTYPKDESKWKAEHVKTYRITRIMSLAQMLNPEDPDAGYKALIASDPSVKNQYTRNQQGERRVDQGDVRLGQGDRGLDLREKQINNQYTLGQERNDISREALNVRQSEGEANRAVRQSEGNANRALREDLYGAGLAYNRERDDANRKWKTGEREATQAWQSEESAMNRALQERLNDKRSRDAFERQDRALLAQRGLAEYNQGQQNLRQQNSLNAQDSMLDKRIAANQDLAELNQDRQDARHDRGLMAQAARQDDQQAFQATEGALNRASQEKRAEDRLTLGRDKLDFDRDKFMVKQAQYREKQRKNMDNTRKIAADSLDTLDHIRAIHLGNTGRTSGVAGGILSFVPETDAYKIEGYKATILNNIGAKRLQEYKNLSPNGASGFGNLSNREFKALCDSITALNPLMGSQEFQWQMDKIERFFEDAFTIKEGTEDDFLGGLMDEYLGEKKKSSLRGSQQQAPAPQAQPQAQAQPQQAPAPQEQPLTPEEQAELAALREEKKARGW